MKRYIILLDKDFKSGCGSDMNKACNYKRHSDIIKDAKTFLNASRFGVHAYLLNDYSQKLCELSPSDFSKHIVNNCYHLVSNN